MSNADEIEIAIADDICKKIDKKKCKTRDEVVRFVEELKEEFMNDVECAFDNIADCYCEEHELEWEE